MLARWNLRTGSIRTRGPLRADRTPVPVRWHHPVTRSLHWATFASLMVAAVAACSREFVVDRATNQLLLAMHEWSGLAVLAVIVLHLAWRACGCVGRRRAAMPRGARIHAMLGHGVLYTMTLILPVLGWLTANAYNQRPVLFGLLPLPTLIERDRELGYALQDWHIDAAWLLLALLLGHVTVALWHHYIRRDNVPRSMQPYRRQRRRNKARCIFPRRVCMTGSECFLCSRQRPGPTETPDQRARVPPSKR